MPPRNRARSLSAAVRSRRNAGSRRTPGSIEARVDAPDERVAAQHGHDEVAPAALGLGRVDLENDAHPEERLRPHPVADEVVERREQRRASAPPSIDRARGAQVRDADEPLARQRSVLAADLDLADPPGLNERRERGVEIPPHPIRDDVADLVARRDAQGPERLRRRVRGERTGLGAGVERRGRQDALGEVPETLALRSSRDQDAAGAGKDLEHLARVALVRPAGRMPADHRPVFERARRERPVPPEAVDDVAAERGVGGDPRPGASRPRGRAVQVRAHAVAVERQVRCRIDERPVLEEAMLLPDRPLERRDVVAAEPAPEDEEVAGRDRAGRVELQPPDALYRAVDRARVGALRNAVEALRAHRQAARGTERDDGPFPRAHRPRLYP